jgi:hypothetical protein
VTSWVQTITILVGVGSLTGMFWRAMNMKFEAFETRLNARMDAGDQHLASRIDGTDAKIDGVEQRLGARIDGTDARIDGLEQRLDTKIDGLGERLDTKIDGAEQRLDAKIDSLAKLTEAQLRPLQEDVSLIKQRLFGQPAA